MDAQSPVMRIGRHRALAKLSPPRSAAFQIVRLGLQERLARADAPKVTLVRAPAGFGKTTLMLQAQQALVALGLRSAWLNCDAADNDLARFLAFLTAAVAQLLGRDDGNSSVHGHEAVGALALELIDDIASAEEPCVLFLDDVESLHNPAALALVRRLIEQLPPQARLVIGSRSLPDIGIARLRGRGELMEIDPALLRFSVAEVGEYLNRQRGLDLKEADLARLHRSTEGWPVALWLASLTLEQRDRGVDVVSDFGGNHTAIADYLAEEVLARQSDQVREFLLQTSILNQLSAGLCDAVRGQADSAQLLEMLERGNLFVIPLDSERQWFRYHSLFSGFLRAQLERLHPGKTRSLHLAAAAWYLSQRRPVPAIEHALASGDLDYALPLFQRHAERLLGEGRVRLLLRLLELIPAEVLQRQPRLRLIQIWAVSFTKGAQEGMALLSQIDVDRADDADVQAHVAGLRPMLLSMLDRNAEAYEVGRRSLEKLPPGYAFPHAILRTSLAYVSTVLGHHAEAQSMLDMGRGETSSSDSPFTLIYAQCVAGAFDLMQARLRLATVRFRLAAGADSRQGSTYTHGNGNAMAGVLLAEALYEAGELDDVERLLKVYVPLVQEVGVPDHVISGHRNLARTQLARGDDDGALQTVTELEYLGHRLGLPRLVASAMLERSRMALLKNDAKTARDELQHARAVGNWSLFTQWCLLGNDSDTPFEAQMRLSIHTGDAESTVAPLRLQLERAEQARRFRRALKLKILLSLALDRSGNDKAAVRLLRDALQSAASERIVRSFLDEGELLQQLLHKLAAAQPGEADELQQAELQQYFSRIGNATAAPLAAMESGSVETLTRKELQVLRLLAEGLTNAGIAGRMFVSETTVRTHLRNVNAKLQVSNRTQATAVARRLGLIA